MAPLWEALCTVYDQLGLDEATGWDEVFRQLVLARIIEPTSKADSLRVLAEAGVDAVSYGARRRQPVPPPVVGVVLQTALERGVGGACTWLFSSMQSTTAFSGGCRYSPTTSRTLASSSGSVENLNVSTRQGCTP